jgi:hypothetical protein
MVELVEAEGPCFGLANAHVPKELGRVLQQAKDRLIEEDERAKDWHQDSQPHDRSGSDPCQDGPAEPV